jgi:Rad3-related DNA helicase
MSGSRNSSSDDYELISVRALRKIREEIQNLKESLKGEDSASKILVEHMNIDLHLQKKLEKMMMHQEDLRKKVGKIVDYFEKAIEEEEDERKTENALLLQRVEELTENNKVLHDKIDSIISNNNDIVTKIEGLKGKTGYKPGSYMFKYRRTKNV